MSRARTPSTNKISQRGSAPAPESRVVDSNDEHRALFTHDSRRGLDALDSMTHPHHRASFVRARLPASAVCHDPRPLPRFHPALAILFDPAPFGAWLVGWSRRTRFRRSRSRRTSSVRGCELLPRSAPSHDVVRTPFVTRALGHDDGEHHHTDFARVETPSSLNTPQLSPVVRLAPSRLPRRRRLVKRPSAFPHRPSGSAAP